MNDSDSETGKRTYLCQLCKHAVIKANPGEPLICVSCLNFIVSHWIVTPNNDDAVFCGVVPEGSGVPVTAKDRYIKFPGGTVELQSHKNDFTVENLDKAIHAVKHDIPQTPDIPVSKTSADRFPSSEQLKACRPDLIYVSSRTNFFAPYYCFRCGGMCDYGKVGTLFTACCICNGATAFCSSCSDRNTKMSLERSRTEKERKK